MRFSGVTIKFKLSIIFITGLGLRLYHIGHRDLWFDEIIAVFKAYNLNFLHIWNPPLYYAVLHYWTGIFGASELSLRFPSLLFSLFCVPIIFLLGRELFNNRAGLYAALIIALNPFHLWYAQEARPYSIAVFFSLLSGYFLFLFINRQQNKFMYYFIVSSIAGLYSNYFYILLLFAQVLCYFILSKRIWSLKRFIFCMLIPFAFIPWLNRFLHKLITMRQETFWLHPPALKSFLITIENFNLGYNSPQILYFISDIIVAILALAAIRLVKNKKELRAGFIYALTLFSLPLLLAYAVSKAITPVYLDRGLMLFSPYYYLILGLGMSFFNKKICRYSAIFCVILVLALGINGFYKDSMPAGLAHHVGTYIKKPVRPAVEFIENNLQPEDKIAFTHHLSPPAFFFYGNFNQETFYKRCVFLYVPGKAVSSSFVKRPVHENRFYTPVDKINNLKFKRLWVIACNWSRDGNIDENSAAVKALLDQRLNLELSREFEGLWIYRYKR